MSPWFLCRFRHAGNTFSKIETFGQYPLQVNGYRDLAECLAGAMVEGELEAPQAPAYGQQVGAAACRRAAACAAASRALPRTVDGDRGCSVRTQYKMLSGCLGCHVSVSAVRRDARSLLVPKDVSSRTSG